MDLLHGLALVLAEVEHSLEGVGVRLPLVKEEALGRRGREIVGGRRLRSRRRRGLRRSLFLFLLAGRAGLVLRLLGGLEGGRALLTLGWLAGVPLRPLLLRPLPLPLPVRILLCHTASNCLCLCLCLCPVSLVSPLPSTRPMKAQPAKREKEQEKTQNMPAAPLAFLARAVELRS